MMTEDEILKQIDKSEHVISRLASKPPGQYRLVNRTRDYHKGRIDALREVLLPGGRGDNDVAPHIEAGVLPKSKELMRCGTCNRVLIFDRPRQDTLVWCACCECYTLYCPRD